MGKAQVLQTIGVDDYDPRMPLADSYPVLKALRERDPVMWHEPTRTWLVTGYQEARAVMQDDANCGQRLELREVSRNGEQVRQQPYFQLLSRILFLRDGDDYGHIRPLMSRWFSGPSRIKSLAPMVERSVDKVIDRLEGKESFDVVKDFAYTIPLTVISELLGVEDSHSAAIANDIHEAVAFIESVAKSPEVKAKADAAIIRLGEFFAELIRERSKNRGDDLLSATIAGYDDGKLVDETELMANVILMYVAGHETTTDSFSRGLMNLFRNRDEMERLRANPALIRGAVEELLRFDCTAQDFSRWPYTDMSAGDKMVKKDSFVLLLQGALNRDPSIFDQPDKLIFERNNTRMLSFGGGAHVCLGNMLARLELQIGLNRVLERMPNLELETAYPSPEDFRPSLTRGLLRLRAHSSTRARRCRRRTTQRPAFQRQSLRNRNIWGR